MEPLPQIRTTAQAELVSAIEQWCSEKGTDFYVDQLLRLVDTEFLRTRGGLAHVKFPKLSSGLPSGKIPNRHWRYWFYHGIAAVLGWREIVTHGDDRYFDDIFHSKVKLVWPDEDFIREVPPINRDEQAWDESLEVDVGLLLSETVPPVSVVASPSEPARKTRVLSMSSVRSPVSFLVTKSPVRISRQWSPCGQPQVTGGVENVRTLRSIKRNLREKKGLDTESLQPFSFGDSEFLEPDSQLQLTAGCVENRVPPSLSDSQKWKGVQSLKDTSTDCSVQRWCRSAGARVEVRTSPMLVEYQAFMRGVDIHDQMRAAYSTGMRTRKWWHRLWWFGIDTCLTNSYICYMHYERELAKRKKQGAVSDSETGSEVRYNHAEFWWKLLTSW
ncbi:hypothetical protein R1sor_009331 [Riccia sorocarpa]|uniref:PiggyBac transposable element-derived protein domain-containing protein n=1 Tax=Riccia sorocarpa TaxID=122646 RepID=A0ABD3HYT3_9MARC